ncbi:MAG TPA: histidine phosphatase family protein [Sphingobacteriaceae bacterium]|nr:histidine phosphatase family protein [Sphingobacteriaceae bacterium]
MTKHLLLIRHAKSDWSNEDLTDFDRPLNNRGHKDAPAMAERLLKNRLVPQHLISSPAKRAITTAKYFADVFQINKNLIQQEEDIYEASSSILLKVINRIDDRYGFVALFGHNPALTSVVIDLSNADISDIPTCGMALIKFTFDDWAMISNGTGKLQFFDYPKNS